MHSIKAGWFRLCAATVFVILGWFGLVMTSGAGAAASTASQAGYGLQSGVYRQIFDTPTPTPTFTPTPTPTPTPIRQVITPINGVVTLIPLPTPTPNIPALPTEPAEGGPSAFYTPTPGTGNYPLFHLTWRRVDEPVHTGQAGRSWIFGPLPYGFEFLRERFEQGSRLVMYHDKGRMEAGPNNTLTLGLIAKELISGNMQVGYNKFEPRLSSLDAVAGDPIETNPDNPTYFSLKKVASLLNDNRFGSRTGQTVIETLDKDGNTGLNFAAGGYGVTYAFYEPVMGHNVASVFWNFMNQTGVVRTAYGHARERVFDWVSVMGLPLTEPYWTRAYVAGRQVDVLVQAFERRVLTYTPSNPPAFQVEMGNVGKHYYKWRYNLHH